MALLWTRALLLGKGALELLTLLISSFALDRNIVVRMTPISQEAKKKVINFGSSPTQ